MSRVLRPFGQGEDELAADCLDLADDVQGPAEELHVLDRQPEDLTLPEPAAGGEGRGEPVARRQRPEHVEVVVGRPGHGLAGEQTWGLDRRCPARVLGDPLAPSGSV